MGVIIGLIVGVAVVVGAVMYFSRAATPFANMQKMERSASASAATQQPQMLEPGTSITDSSSGQGLVEAPPPPAASRPASAPASVAPQPAPNAQQQKNKAAKAAQGKDQDGQRFDFYKILPGQVDPVTTETPSASVEPGPAKKPYLQLGAFQNQDDADNLKAKLALLGIEATIQSVSVPGKGMLHRVRVGPFPRQEDIDRVKAQLKQNGIVNVVKLAN